VIRFFSQGTGPASPNEELLWSYLESISGQAFSPFSLGVVPSLLATGIYNLFPPHQTFEKGPVVYQAPH